MEEKRAFPHPLYNSFSKNALKARIIALSKNRGISRLTATVGVFLLVILFIVFSTSSLQIGGDISQVERIIGESEIFTESEINDMMDSVTRYFRFFPECTLSELSYDEEFSLRESDNRNAKAGEYAVILSTFHTHETPPDGSFEPNFTYRGWTWTLKRTIFGGWKIISFGYA